MIVPDLPIPAEQWNNIGYCLLMSNFKKGKNSSISSG